MARLLHACIARSVQRAVGREAKGSFEKEGDRDERGVHSAMDGRLSALVGGDFFIASTFQYKL